MKEFDEIMDRYIEHADRSPHNALVERPQMVALLPDLQGRVVVDVGTGSGFYAKHALSRGARVTAIDLSQRALDLLPDSPRLAKLHHDIREGLPLSLEMPHCIIASLVLHYVHDWTQFVETSFAALPSGGHLVASVGHPFGDFIDSKRENYFATERVREYWRSFDIRIPVYHRSMGNVLNPFLDTGFLLTAFAEPMPRGGQMSPKTMELGRMPAFLCMVWSKP